MDIIVIFPEQYFTSKQLASLRKFNLTFIAGKDLDLDRLKDLYTSDEFILAIDPGRIKENWNSLPIERIKKMKGLKALCLTTTAFGWVDLKKTKDLGIIVTNTPGKSTEAVAEFNIYMMFSLLRKTPLIIKNNGQMDYDKFQNDEAAGKVAGILGLGTIGSRVAQLCKNLGMKVIYWDRKKKISPYTSVSTTKLFEESDVVFNTLAGAPELKGFIDKKLLSLLKPTSIIVNTSPSLIFDTDFIFSHVEKNKLGGYAFESHEKGVLDYKGNIMVFPEQAYYTLGTLQNTARILTETILSVINNKPVNKVN